MRTVNFFIKFNTHEPYRGIKVRKNSCGVQGPIRTEPLKNGLIKTKKMNYNVALYLYLSSLIE